MTNHPPPWLRGPVAEVQPVLQPVAHALLDAAEEVGEALASADPDVVWKSPGAAASAGFHVLHAMGSLDRLYTYARGESLSDEQKAVLAREANPANFLMPRDELARAFAQTIERALSQIRSTGESHLLEARRVGRAGLPSTVLGLLFHGAEHTQRHVGQMTTTFKVLRG